MPDKLTCNFMDRERLPSCYQWVNIDRDSTRVGKARVLAEGETLIIYSLNIFPEFEGKGYARKVIETFKISFGRVIADRVRHKAVGFWVKMGFSDRGRGRYVFDKTGEILNLNIENGQN